MDELKTGLKCPNCSCFGFTLEEDGNAKCLSCGTIYRNGHPMEQRNEPSAEEIVRALRHCSDMDRACYSGQKDNQCPYYDKGLMAHPNDKNYTTYCDILMDRDAADRLEAQERTIADKDAKIAELTARAENAERERDAADNGSYDLYKRFESISDEVRKESPSCKLCGNFPERCAFCLKYNAFELRGLRGLPQDGEGK